MSPHDHEFAPQKEKRGEALGRHPGQDGDDVRKENNNLTRQTRLVKDLSDSDTGRIENDHLPANYRIAPWGFEPQSSG